ncbi:MAG TPA: hypothetical protein VFE86_17500 [Ilumatobacteraceae bacterium]|nr:hypothetical protein [Ilumatobacteraceae bacterium]
MENDLLGIYLSDHLAGATAGCRRMRRLADAEQQAPDADALQRIAKEIDEDRATLLSIIEAEGIEPRWYKTAMAKVGEAVGVVKSNGTLFHRSPLTSLVELEGMRMGVTAKFDLWTALKHSELSGRQDFDRLLERATRQLQELEVAHVRRAEVLRGARQSQSVGSASTD